MYERTEFLWMTLTDRPSIRSIDRSSVKPLYLFKDRTGGLNALAADEK